MHTDGDLSGWSPSPLRGRRDPVLRWFASGHIGLSKLINGFSEEVLPRTRGFTHVFSPACRYVAGSSAHARVHPDPRSALCGWKWFFRTRAGSPLIVTMPRLGTRFFRARAGSPVE